MGLLFFKIGENRYGLCRVLFLAGLQLRDSKKLGTLHPCSCPSLQIATSEISVFEIFSVLVLI